MYFCTEAKYLKNLNNLLKYIVFSDFGSRHAWLWLHSYYIKESVEFFMQKTCLQIFRCCNELSQKTFLHNLNNLNSRKFIKWFLIKNFPRLDVLTKNINGELIFTRGIPNYFIDKLFSWCMYNTNTLKMIQFS